MDAHDLKEESLGENGSPRESPLATELESALKLGEHVVGCAADLVDLARMETQLAIQSLPKLIMLWFLMMPVLLLTWCSLSILIAWCAYAASEAVVIGMVTFFLLQLLLLLGCRWLYNRYRIRMSLPNTRAQINTFLKAFNYGSSNESKVEK